MTGFIQLLSFGGKYTVPYTHSGMGIIRMVVSSLKKRVAQALAGRPAVNGDMESPLGFNFTTSC